MHLSWTSSSLPFPPDGHVKAHRALVFPIVWHDPRLDWLLAEFRLLVNESIRVAFEGDIRSRARLASAAYADMSERHPVHKKYIPSAFGVALAVLKAYRRRLRKGKRSAVPFARRPILVAENQSYWLDRQTGRIRIPIQGTEGVQLHLPLSEWHRSFLRDPAWGLGSLTVVPGRIILVVRRESPDAYEPEGAIALDTNEDSLDGVVASDAGIVPTVLPFGGVRRIQQTHFRRRRRLATKKAQDRRVMRRLGNREGRRDRMGKVFVCLLCDWEMDRQINAGMNILKTALASNEALARAVRFQPGALRHDVVIPLYDLLREGGGAREEPSGVELGISRIA